MSAFMRQALKTVYICVIAGIVLGCPTTPTAKIVVTNTSSHVVLTATLDGGSAFSVGVGGNYTFTSVSAGSHTVSVKTDANGSWTSCGSTNVSQACTHSIKDGETYTLTISETGSCFGFSPYTLVLSCP